MNKMNLTQVPIFYWSRSQFQNPLRFPYATFFEIDIGQYIHIFFLSLYLYRYAYISYIDLAYILKVVILLYTFRESVEGKMKNAHEFCQRSSIERHTFQAECDYWEDQLHEHLGT